MLALEAYEAGLCQRCGEPLEVSTALENDFNNIFGTGVYLPVPNHPAQCHCCAALQRSERDTAALNPQFPAAMIHAVRLMPRR
ncbi:hypothetical protein ABZY58_25975 [Micromonospora tulbaghiae]|uniref:hypothetical protein n=1 Tax=Micromonospora tulbaghiae TaxID=479978 RepID=UPI0033B59670